MPVSHILVVEDDPLILMLALGIIEDEGYIALNASDADEAMVCSSEVPRSESSLPISRCPVRWTGWNWRPAFASDGPISRYS